MSFSLKDAGKRLGCTSWNVHLMRAAGKISGAKVGNRWQIDEASVMKFIDEHPGFEKKKRAGRKKASKDFVGMEGEARGLRAKQRATERNMSRLSEFFASRRNVLIADITFGEVTDLITSLEV